MSSLNSCFFAIGVFAVLAGAIGCEEPRENFGGVEPVAVIDLPKLDLSPLDPENTLVFTVTTAPSEIVNFSVYVGSNVSDEYRVEAISEDGLADQICSEVDNELAANSDLNAVLIECDGRLKTGDIEFIKRAVARSTGSSSLRLFIGILGGDNADTEDRED